MKKHLLDLRIIDEHIEHARDKKAKISTLLAELEAERAEIVLCILLEQSRNMEGKK